MSSPGRAAPASPFAARPAALWLLAFLIAHVLVWTVVAGLTQPNAPYDVVFLLMWGDHLDWGYNRHPPLPTWLLEAFWQASGRSLWSAWLLSQLSVAGAFAAVWALGRELLDDRRALLAVLALEGAHYYTLSSPEYNNNVGLLPFWAALLWCGWQGVRGGGLGWWIGAGLSAGLACLCKYIGVLPVLALLAYLLADRDARRHWRGAGPWLFAVTLALVLAPHVQWMVEHDFITLRYASDRAQSEAAGLLARLWRPLEFLLAQLLAVVPVFLVLAPLVRRRLRAGLASDAGWRYLSAVFLGPPAIMIAGSLATGAKLHDMWGYPLWLPVGVWLLLTLEPAEPVRYRAAARRAGVVAAVMVLATVVYNVGGPLLSGDTRRIHFPGPALSAAVERAWHDRHDERLPVVGGEWWLAGNAAMYAADQPVAYGDLDPEVTPWVSDVMLQERGGVLVWDAAAGAGPPDAMRARFPALQPAGVVRLDWQTAADVPPVLVGLAVVPPAIDRHGRHGYPADGRSGREQPTNSRNADDTPRPIIR